MARRWKVLTLVSVGVFMVSLDLFIVNIAFPKIEGDFPGSSVSSISSSPKRSSIPRPMQASRFRPVQDSKARFTSR